MQYENISLALTSAARELAPGGEVHGSQSFPFEFSNVDTSMDSYRGTTARLRYILRVVISKGVGGISQDFPIWVQNPSQSPPIDEPIKVCCRILIAYCVVSSSADITSH
jgi:hypothetical protein